MKRQLFILLLLSAAAFTTNAQVKPVPPAEPHDHSHISKTANDASPAEKYFTDVELTNQDGKKVHFYSDVLKGKTVVVNAFFTTCTSVCPPMNRNME
jgi:cytochrome oxidase Cu insertion factor (SCO1/SenC/PrrC family)